MAKERFRNWAITRFPEGIRNKFVGMCKERGLRVKDVVEYLITKWIRERKNEERKRHDQD